MAEMTNLSSALALAGASLDEAAYREFWPLLRGQTTVPFYDGAWQVRFSQTGRGGPRSSFPSREKAEAFASILARVISPA